MILPLLKQAQVARISRKFDQFLNLIENMNLVGFFFFWYGLVVW